MSKQHTSFVPMMDPQPVSDLTLVGAIPFGDSGVRWADAVTVSEAAAAPIPELVPSAVAAGEFTRYAIHVVQGV